MNYENLKERFLSWQTTTFGFAICAGWIALAQYLPPGCKESLGSIATYGPAVLSAVIGALLRGPSKIDPKSSSAKLTVLLLSSLFLFSACVGPQVQIPMGPATVAWGNVRAMYATGMAIAIQMRKEKKLDDASWNELKAEHVKAQVLRQEIERALMNPVNPPDWEKIMQYSEQAIGLMMKLGL